VREEGRRREGGGKEDILGHYLVEHFDGFR